MRKPKFSRRAAVNVMLYVGVVAMAMITYYDLRGTPGGAEQAMTFTPEAVSALSIHRPGFTTIAIERDDEHWRITKPVSIEADPSRVTALLTLNRLDPELGYSALELDLAELGLGVPQATVGLTIGESQLQILVGGLGPNNTRRYIQAGQHVWLVDDIYLPLLRGGLRAFARLSLVPQASELTAVVFADGRQLDDSQTLAEWSQTAAAGIVPAADYLSKAGQSFEIKLAGDKTLPYSMIDDSETIALIPANADYALLISAEQAQRLGVIAN